MRLWRRLGASGRCGTRGKSWSQGRCRVQISPLSPSPFLLPTPRAPSRCLPDLDLDPILSWSVSKAETYLPCIVCLYASNIQGALVSPDACMVFVIAMWTTESRSIQTICGPSLAQ